MSATHIYKEPGLTAAVVIESGNGDDNDASYKLTVCEIISGTAPCAVGESFTCTKRGPRSYWTLEKITS